MQGRGPNSCKKGGEKNEKEERKNRRRIGRIRKGIKTREKGIEEDEYKMADNMEDEEKGKKEENFSIPFYLMLSTAQQSSGRLTNNELQRTMREVVVA
jgi:hypothetical protein